jgi:hypothetical protein
MGRKVLMTAALVIHQPSAALIRYVHRIFGEQLLLTRVDLAMDIHRNSQNEADTLFQWLKVRLMKPWYRSEHGIRELGEGSDATLYIGFNTWRSKIRIYGGRPSKLTSRPCVHVEWSLASGASVRSTGLKGLTDLLTFSHANFWRRKLRLREVNLDALGKLIRGRRPNTRSRQFKVGRQVINLDEEEGRLFLEQAALRKNCAVDQLMVHDAVDAIRTAGLAQVKSTLRPLDIRPFIPLGRGMGF